MVALIILILAVLAVFPAARAALAVYRFIRLPAEGRRHYLPARWHRLRWKRLSRNLGLAAVDKHLGGLDSRRAPKVNYPKVRFRADEFGWAVHMKLIPGVSREEVEKAGVHLANAWGAWRVGIQQPRPGRLVVRALRRDPLAEPLPATVLPGFDGRHLVLGRDQESAIRRASLANHSGSCWAGNPGRGKTEAALSLAYQLAPSPLVDMHVLDGGACDWQHFDGVAASYVADDLDAAADLLAGLDRKMGTRRQNLEADLGVRNGWVRGPSPAYKLQWVLIEESPFYLSLETVKGDKRREGLVTACRGFTTSLLRRGRAPLFHTSLVSQRLTTSSLPSDIRDLCGLRWSFGCSTVDAAVAAVGDDIRRFETMSPVQLQGDEHVGVACARLVTGTSPYTLLRFPAIGEDLADATVLELARRRDPDLEAVADRPAARLVF